MISAIVLTKNEENNIRQCITSLLWCDEIIVIDDNSTDRTLKILEDINSNKIKVFQKNLHEDFASQRNYGLQKVSGDWILFIDADEIVSPSLQYEIMNTVNNNMVNKSGYFIKRKDFMWGKPINYGESNTMKFLRLAQKSTGLWEGKVHEIWKIQGQTSELKNYIIHNPHRTIAAFLKEINYYTDIRSMELYTKEKKTNLVFILLFSVGKFFQNYIIRKGFLDGVPGLILATMMSFHSYLVRSKLWFLWQQDKGLLRTT